MVDFFDLARAGGAAIRLAELLVAEGSKLVGQTVDQLCGSAIALLIRRVGGEMLPNPSRHAVVESGDVVVMFGELDTLRP